MIIEKIKESYKDESEAIETKAIEAIGKNSKVFFKYANQRRKVKSRIGPLLTGNTHTQDAQEMADIL